MIEIVMEETPHEVFTWNFDTPIFNPVRLGVGEGGSDGQTHSCQSETSCSMMPKLGDL